MRFFEGREKKEKRIREAVLKELREEQKRADKEHERLVEEDRQLLKKEALLVKAAEKLKDKAAEEKTAQLKASSEPWVVVKGMVEDPKEGVKIELDWNDAFIEYLKQNGITGVDEDTIIQKYITLMMQDVAESMSEGQSSEYE